MAEFAYSLTAQAVLDNASRSIGSNRILERADLAVVSIAIPAGQDKEVKTALTAGWGLEMPSAATSSSKGNVTAVQTAPDQLFLVFAHVTPDAEAHVKSKLNGVGYTTDQTDAWVVLEVSGPDTMAALERICPLDLEGFSNGGFGRTSMEHLGAMILRQGPDTFLLFSASSSAQSFLHAVELSYQNTTDERHRPE